jgi:hypothetical protein
MAVGHIRRVPLPLSVLSAGRQAFRTYGAATAQLRPPPDFLIIGAKRGGTTSAYFSLLEHPQVLPLFPSARYVPKRRDGKGPHYFDSHYEKGDRWYLGHFPSRFTRRRAEQRLGGPVVVGEASPYYSYHPLAAERAARLAPDVKLLLFLRDPVERTFSAWKEQRRNGVETLDFPAALAAEAERTAGEAERIIAEPGYRSFAHEFQSYRAQSEYARSLARWLQHFPREQFKVVASENYSADAGAVCNEIYDFLGLPQRPAAPALKLNAATASPMPEDVRAELTAHFAPHTAELERMLGQTFPWTRPASDPAAALTAAGADT